MTKKFTLNVDGVELTKRDLKERFDKYNKHLVELFLSVITRHIGNIYSEGELLRESTSAKIAFVPETRDRTYEVTFYNLDVKIDCGLATE